MCSSYYVLIFIVLTWLNLNCIAHNPCQQPCPLISIITSTRFIRQSNYLIDGRLGLICRHVRRCDYLFLQDDRLTTIAVILANERERCVCGMTNRRTNSKFRSIHRVFDVAFNFHKTLVFFLLLSFFFLFCFCIRVPSTFYMFTELYRSLKRTRPNEYAKKKKKRNDRLESRLEPIIPGDGLDVFSTFHTNFSTDLSTMVTIKSLSLPRCHIFSYARMSRLEPSRRPASLLQTRPTRADVDRERYGTSMRGSNILAIFRLFFFFFLSSFSSLPSSPPSNQINLANSGEKNDQSSRSSISNYACSRNIARSNIGIDTLLYTRGFFFSFFSTIIEPRRIRLPLISKALETRD